MRGKRKVTEETAGLDLLPTFDFNPHKVFDGYRNRTLVVLDIEDYLETVCGLSPRES